MILLYDIIDVARHNLLNVLTEEEYESVQETILSRSPSEESTISSIDVSSGRAVRPREKKAVAVYNSRPSQRGGASKGPLKRASIKINVTSAALLQLSLSQQRVASANSNASNGTAPGSRGSLRSGEIFHQRSVSGGFDNNHESISENLVETSDTDSDDNTEGAPHNDDNKPVSPAHIVNKQTRKSSYDGKALIIARANRLVEPVVARGTDAPVEKVPRVVPQPKPPDKGTKPSKAPPRQPGRQARAKR